MHDDLHCGGEATIAMQVIPVIDIMGGVAVHARRGERSAYRPIRSVLLQGADPVALLRAYRETLECDVVYIADLDAIMGRGNNLAIISKMAVSEPRLELLVDAGIHNVVQARRLLDAGTQKVIIASESLTSLDAASGLLTVLGTDRTLFSLDLTAQDVTWQKPSTESKDASATACRLLSLGFREVILLRMDRIGVGGGADTELLGRVARTAPGMRFIVGGGIASVAELSLLQRAGASGALLATALHSGAITREDLIRTKAEA
jgi:phosphoribosylformimino-5-aminoimidazole carboxamide ribotide isomerase